MALYITLMNFTEQGIKNIKESPARVDAAREMMAGIGAELKAFYLTMGSYDAVAVTEAPSDEVAAKIALTVGAGGNARTLTMRAFDEAAYREIIAGL
ncbi:MAG: GYD domain-containing protein [Alphaproteobacteria bacterium]|jgi:uncharacterized protein with GYD domain|nr:GYD domain-containing protein [Alphaproteobacteria bacterium]